MKRWFSLLLALVLTVSCIPVPHAHAHEADEPHVHTHEEAVLPEETAAEEAIPEEAVPEETVPEENVPEETVPVERIFVPIREVAALSHMAKANNDALFAGYVDSVFYPAQAQALRTEAGDQLSGDLRKLYDGICWLFKKVASGERTSTEIEIGRNKEYNVTLSGNGVSQAEIQKLMSAFLSDLVYEQYWFDKTTGFWYGDGGSYMYFGFVVAENYRGSDEFHTNAAITGAATKSAANARKIVTNNAGKTDYQKLRAYSDTICDLVEYDYDAAYRGDFARDNDPWQMIHTFDGDPNTNIVCEGYSKSFKYLCDQSDFDNESIISYTVTGDAGGPHMWNIVSVNGANYHVDVTNVDGGWDLFMVGGSGSVTGGYNINGIRYTYDSETRNLWGTGSGSILKLSSKAYNPNDCTGGHTPGAAPTCTEAQTCTVCGAVLAQALGHAPGSAATCTKDQTCTRCGAVVTAALGHAWVEDSVKNGMIYYRCSRCGATKSEPAPNEDEPPFLENEWEVLILTNKERYKEGLTPLTGFAKLQKANDVRAKELVDLFSHTRPNGSSCFTALDEAGVKYSSAGENIAAGYNSPQDVMTGWMNSSGHRANILDSGFRHIGIGYHYDSSAYYRYHWVQMFASHYSEKNTDFVLVYPEGTTFKPGTSIDDMGIFAKVKNSVYGTCYLPIISEFCSGYDPSSSADQTVTVSALGFQKTFTVFRGGEEHTHSFGDWYEIQAPTCTEAGQQRRDCSCGAYESRDTDPLGHDPDREPSCTKDQICNRCNKILTPALGHEPGPDATCTEDQYCTRCGTRLARALGHAPNGEATCTEDQICVRCGTVLTPALGHMPGAEATCTKGQNCTRCGEELAPKLGHNPGPEATCTDDQICKRCGELLQIALGHEPGPGANCTDDQICKRCGEELAPKLGHAPVTVPGKEPTCTEPGFTDGRQCARCDQVIIKQEEIPALGHDPVTVSGTPPTCTDPGLSEGSRCDRCGEVLAKQEVIPAKGHTPGPGASCTEPWTCIVCGEQLAPAAGHTPGPKATCTEDQVCTVCGEVLAEALGHNPGPDATCTDPQTCQRCEIELSPALGHDPVTVPGKEPTCTEPGLTDGSKCSRCGETLQTQEVIPAKGHTPGPGASCTEPWTCIVCGAELAPAAGHTPGPEATCTEPQTCTICGEVLAKALGHNPGPDATCTDPQTCQRCEIELSPALGHDAVIIPGTEPTCTETGLTDGSYCARCGITLTEQEEIPATGHIPGPEPTVDAPQVCTVCGVMLADKLPHIRDCTFYLVENMVYTGKALKPDVTVTTPDGVLLFEGIDYTLSYKNNTKIGKADITVTGLGTYGGKTTVNFTIVPGQAKNLRLSSVSSTTAKVAYDKVPGASSYRIYVDGKLKGTTTSTSYTVKGLKAGVSYEITVESAKKVNKTTYYGRVSDPFTVVPGTSITKYKASLSYTSTEYDGTEKRPEPRLKVSSKKNLVLGTDYTVTYENNVQIGKATVTFTGIGKYVGTITKTFDIKLGKVTGVTCEVVDPTSVQISFDKVPGARYYKVYVGGKQKALITRTSCILEELKTGTSYKITVKAAAQIDGKEYVGEASTGVSVKPSYDLTKCAASLSYETTTYSGKSKSPTVTVRSESGSKLKKGTHYTVSYKSNKSVGLATVTVTGKGSYGGTIVLNFEIVPSKVSSLSFSSITGDSAKVSWKKVSGASWYRIWLDGEPLDNVVYGTSTTLTGLEAGRTYLVEVHAGKTVNGEDYCGQLTAKELTPTWDLSKFTLTLEPQVTYTGESVFPVPTVTDEDGSILTEDVDYTVVYKNNVKIGKASLTVTGMGKYRGSVTKSFKIVPGQVENVALVSVSKTSAKISFDKVSGASTYYIYVNGKQKGSTSSSTYTVKGLKAGKTYEITVVAAKKVSKTTYKGDPSDVLTVTTNK